MNTPRTWLLLAIALASCAGAFWATRIVRSHGAAEHGLMCPGCNTVHTMSHASGGRPSPQEEVAWMKTEFGLSDAELRKVEQLHSAYIPRCDENCRRIELAGAKVGQLVEQSGGMSAELAAAIREEEKARADCRVELMAHLYETAAAMPPEAGREFLRSAIPTVCPTAHPDVHGAMAH